MPARLAISQRRPADGVRLLDLVAERLEVLGHRDSPQIAWRSMAALAARLSYQGRTIDHAGFGAGLAATFDW